MGMVCVSRKNLNFIIEVDISDPFFSSLVLLLNIIRSALKRCTKPTRKHTKRRFRTAVYVSILISIRPTYLFLSFYLPFHLQLLMYWYGVPDPNTGLNLATCIWQSRAHAAAANARPNHIRAMRLAKDAYAIYALERHVLRKRRGETGVRVETYEGGDVGW